VNRPSPAFVPLTPRREILLLLAIRWRMLRHFLASLRQASRFKGGVLFLAALTLVGCLFIIFFHGFKFLESDLFDGFREWITDLAFSVFFFCLGMMLVFSVGVTVYVALYRAEETAFLMQQPLRYGSVFLIRFVESLLYSTLAFAFLSSPLLAAFWMARKSVPFHFLPLSLAGLCLFVWIPGAVGTTGTMLLCTYLPRRIRWNLALLFLGVVVGSFLLFSRSFVAGSLREAPPADYVVHLMEKFDFSLHPFLPSSWISRSMLASSLGRWGETWFFMTVLASYALFVLMVAVVFADRRLLVGWTFAHAGKARARRWVREGLYRLVTPVFYLFGREQRLLLGKDLRTFLRDPAQWSQFSIFFGLLAVYFFNLKKLPLRTEDAYWKNIVSFLNFSATALTLCTFTSRFIFPMLSLEGRRFWVLGLMPMSRGGLLYGKFAFAFLGTSLVSVILLWVSDRMLDVPRWLLVMHLYTCLLASFGLSGMAVGMGALFPDFREDNPAKIVSGFGGTLNLVLGLGFLILMILFQALPVHLWYGKRILSDEHFRVWATAALLSASALSLAAFYVPMRLGRRAFERMDF
jgi:ABC-2 type transport system permease protein